MTLVVRIAYSMDCDIRKLIFLTLFCSVASFAKDRPIDFECETLLSDFTVTKSVLAQTAGGPERLSIDTKWAFDGTYPWGDPHSYNRTFQAVLGERGLERWAIRRKRLGLSAHVLDLFGAGVFSPLPQAFDSLTGARLGPVSTRVVDPVYDEANWRQVTGDLFLRATWNRLDETTALRGISKFDLIVIRSQGPFQVSAQQVSSIEFPALLRLYHAILSRAWGRLSTSGILLTEMSSPISNTKEFQAWLERLRAAGIPVVEQKGKALKIERTPLSPDVLPR